jgi:hypothetical protein
MSRRYPRYRSIYLLTALLILVILSSCGSSKINSTPKFIGASTGDRLLVCNLIGNKDDDYQSLTTWANETLKSKSGIDPVSYSDSEFTLKQFGIDLSAMNSVDSTTAKLIAEKLNLDFILFTKIGYLKDNLETGANNSDYNLKEAKLYFTLYDLNLNRLIWKCDIETTISPLIYGGGRLDYSINPLSSDNALNRSYRNGIKRMIKSFKVQLTSAAK